MTWPCARRRRAAQVPAGDQVTQHRKRYMPPRTRSRTGPGPPVPGRTAERLAALVVPLPALGDLPA
ncbi:hypothetical protein ACU686_44785 [Yinghuangia aomiensis]